MDEWTVDLLTWFGWVGVLDKLSPEELKAIERVRLKVVVAIDVATRCILAMRFSHAAAVEKTTIDAIEMMVSDKSSLAAISGATSLWPYHLTPESAVADNGGPFKNVSVKAVMSAIDCQYMHPPTGTPWLRGAIESVFKTFGQQFCAWFEGRTFGSIFERGDYRSSSRVSLSMDQLNLLLVQAVVDIYHFQPHSMTGETPHARWMRLSEKYGVLPPPPSKTRRAIFGTRVNREITDAGIVFFGIQYQSKAIQQFRLQAKSTALVKVDRFNLNAISMWNGEGWLTVPATIRIPEGVSIWEWTGAAREVAAEHADSAQTHLSSMLNAVNRLRLSGAAAAARAGIVTAPIDEATLLKQQSQYFDNVMYIDNLGDQDPELAPLLLADDPLSVGIPGIDDTLAMSLKDGSKVELRRHLANPPAATAIRTTDDIEI